MNEENLKKYNKMAARVNSMSDEEIDKLIKEGKCPFEPEHMVGEPIGQFHCPVCGQMVLAGLKHFPPLNTIELDK